MPLSQPLRLAPVLVDKPWGGDRLGRWGYDVAAGARVGEAWVVADLAADATPVPDPVSRVRGGPHDGAALSELVAADPGGLLGPVAPTTAGRFPLLVKLLDARESLSVQVHPPRSLAPDEYKTESWVVLDAEPGGELLLGVDDGVGLDDVRRAIGTPELLPLLRRVPVATGDVVHVPAGTVHALGAGVLVAEVQTTSDVTHRLWDWPELRGGGRALHLEEGLRSIAAGWEHNLGVDPAPADATGRLVTTEAYELDRLHLTDGERGPDGDGRPRVVVVLEGTAVCGTARLGRGEVALLPAACGLPVVADGPARVLVATAV